MVSCSIRRSARDSGDRDARSMPDTFDTAQAPVTCLLVPLDGSRLAEAVLPAVEALAGQFGARVVLIHVLEARAPATVHGERHLMNATGAERYLTGIAERLRARGIAVETHVHAAPEGDLAGSVVEHAEEFRPDLVVLCAHGRGG